MSNEIKNYLKLSMNDEEWQAFCLSIHQLCDDLFSERVAKDVARVVCAHESWRWENRPEIPAWFITDKAKVYIKMPHHNKWSSEYNEEI